MTSPSNALTATEPAELAATPETIERARDLIAAGTPANTIRAREGALRYFWAWADLALGLGESYPIHPDVVLTFATDHLTGLAAELDVELVASGIKAKLGPHSVATVEARVSHLAAAHAAQGFNSPTDARTVEVLKASRKLRGRSGGQATKAAATLEVLNAMLATCDGSIAGIRDRALLLAAFASGGRRRSEIAAAAVEDLERVSVHLHRPADHRTQSVEYVLTVRHSKTDQTGEGLAVPIAGRAAQALTQWLDIAEISAGPIFRKVSKGGKVGDKAINGRTVARIVKARAELAGQDPAAFGGHSLRAGFVTSAGQAGVALPEVMAMSGHKTASVAARYHRVGHALHNQAARLAG